MVYAAERCIWMLSYQPFLDPQPDTTEQVPNDHNVALPQGCTVMLPLANPRAWQSRGKGIQVYRIQLATYVIHVGDQLRPTDIHAQPPFISCGLE